MTTRYLALAVVVSACSTSEPPANPPTSTPIAAVTAECPAPDRSAKANFAFDDRGGASGLDTCRPAVRPFDIDADFTNGSIVPGGRITLSAQGDGWRVRLFLFDQLEVKADTDTAYDGHHTATLPTTAHFVLAPAATPAGMTGSSHGAVGYDPRFGEAAFRVATADDCARAVPDTGPTTNWMAAPNTAPVFAPRGPVECYRLILFQPFIKKNPDPIPDEYIPHIARATIAVAAFDPNNPGQRLAAPSVLRAKIDEPWRVMTYRDSTGTVITSKGYELSVTADARFLFYTHLTCEGADPTGVDHSPAARSFQGVSFNPKPWDPSSEWTQPLSIDDMHALGGKTACFATSDAGCGQDDPREIALARKYPVLAQPLVNADGSPFQGLNACVYPWISFDGEEVFCNSVGGFVQAAVGRRTRWTWTVLDGTINRVRYGCDAGPDPATVPSNACRGFIRAQAFGLTSGPWGVPRELDLAQLGIRGEPDHYVLSVNGPDPAQTNQVPHVGEVGFDSFTDGGYLGYFPFTEMLIETDPSARPKVSRLDLTRTPDTSGNFLATTKVGVVKFFYDLYATASYNESQNGRKWVGNSLFAGTGSYLKIAAGPNTPAAAQQTLAAPSGALTIGFAFQYTNALPGAPATGCYRVLVQKPGAYQVCVSATGAMLAQIAARGAWYTTDEIEYPAAAPNAWTHVTLRFLRGIGLVVNLYRPGDVTTTRVAFQSLRAVGGGARLVLNAASAPPIDAGQPMIYAGGAPGDTATTVFGIDELSISPSYRDDPWVADAELSRFQRGARAVASFAPLAGALGLDARDVRVPANLRDKVGTPAFDEIADLGQELFADPALSRDANGAPQGVSCATCHVPILDANHAFTDGRRVAIGVGGRTTGKNAPTVIGRAFSVMQMFERTATDLTQQPRLALTNPAEMNADLGQVTAYLRSRQADLDAAWGAPVDLSTQAAALRALSDTLAAYLMREVPGRSRIDTILYLPGHFLPQEAGIARGMAVFLGKGRCVGCHRMSNFSDELPHATGVAAGAVKTPTLRNIARTAPYFHDGTAASLDAAIGLYAQGGNLRDHQTEIVATPLEPGERTDLATFLRALSSN